jgi:predicted PurR-regulated permease PerM
MGHLLDGSPRSVARATLLVLGVGLAFVLAWAFSDVLIALMFAMLIGTGLYPLVDRLERHGVKRRLAACSVYLMMAAVAGALIVLVLPMVIERVQAFLARLPAAHDAIRDRLSVSSSLLLRRMGGQLPAQVVSPLPTLGIGPQGALSFTGSAGRALAGAAAVLLASFHFTIHGRHIVARVLMLAPRARRARLRDFSVLLEQRLGAWLRAQGIVCLTVGVLMFAAYSLIGLQDALVLGLLAGVLEVLPYFGPVLAAVPALLIALATSPSKALGVLAIVAGVHLFENLFLVPRVMNKAVGVPPAFGLLAIATLGALLGLSGAMLAIPAVVVLQLAYHHFVEAAV